MRTGCTINLELDLEPDPDVLILHKSRAHWIIDEFPVCYYYFILLLMNTLVCLLKEEQCIDCTVQCIVPGSLHYYTCKRCGHPPESRPRSSSTDSRAQTAKASIPPTSMQYTKYCSVLYRTVLYMSRYIRALTTGNSFSMPIHTQSFIIASCARQMFL